MTTQFELNLKRWTRPANWFGTPWPDYYVFLGRTRDSDALARSNFDAGLVAVRAVASKDSIPGDADDGATVVVVSESHWACGWVEWIAIHESDTAALLEASRINDALACYPVVDEDLFSEYETTEANAVWKYCYRPKERVEYIRKHASQFDFRNLADLLGCVRGNYFEGYAGELLH